MPEPPSDPATLADAMARDAAEAVRSLGAFEVALDYDLSGLEALETAIPRLQRLGERFGDEARRESYLRGLGKVLGAYVGETIRRRHGGDWVLTDGRPGLSLPVGFIVFPHHKVGKRLRGGADESIASFVGVMGEPRFWDSLRSGGERAPDASPDAPVLAVTGLAREARIAAGEGVVTLCCGGSPARLRALLEAYDGPRPRAVVSFGIAGGLDPALKVGDAVIATGVAAEGRTLAADPALAAALVERIGLGAIPGLIAAAEAALIDPAAKAEMRAATGAAAVDLESGPAAAYAAQRGLPFAAIRVVCDPAGRRLPPLALTALKPDGGVDLAAVLSGLARDPGQVPALIAAGRDSAKAFRRLSRLRGLLGDGLGLRHDVA